MDQKKSALFLRLSFRLVLSGSLFMYVNLLTADVLQKVIHIQNISRK